MPVGLRAAFFQHLLERRVAVSTRPGAESQNLPDKLGRIRAGLRRKFLDSSGKAIGDVEIPLLIRHQSMQAIESSGLWARFSPTVKKTAIEIELEESMGAGIAHQMNPSWVMM